MVTDGDSNEPVIIIDKLTTTTVDSGAQEEVYCDSKKFTSNVSWDLDADLLTSQNIAAICSDIIPKAQEHDVICALEQVGLYYTERALAAISLDEVANMRPYHKKM